MPRQKDTQETETDKWIEATAKLMWMTHDYRLKWARDNPSKRSDEENAYTTEYKGKRLRLVEKGPAHSQRTLKRLQDYDENTHYIVLEVVDEHGHRLGTFPQTSVLPDLMASVRAQSFDMENLRDEILNEP
jgi:hypothetical protein